MGVSLLRHFVITVPTFCRRGYAILTYPLFQIEPRVSLLVFRIVRIASIDNVMTLIKILLGNPNTFRGNIYRV